MLVRGKIRQLGAKLLERRAAPARSRVKEAKRRPPAVVRIFGYFFTVGVILFIVGSAGAAFALWKYSRELPDYAALQNYEPPIMTRLYANDGQLLAEYAKERRLYVPIQAMPKRLINAFLAAEDKNFYEHNGLDYLGIARAVVFNAENKVTGRSGTQGASTITQQVSKNFLLSNERTIDRKVKEALISLKIERAFSKEQILELYLNEIYLGMGSYGVAAASLVYFGKSVHDLTVAEAAYLGALPKAPNNYHPFRFKDRAVERRNWVIGEMAEAGFITSEERDTARAEPMNVTPRATGAQIYAGDFFAEEVRRTVYERFGEKGLYEGGLSVRTTLDPKLQSMARKALVDGLVAFDQRTGWRGPVGTMDASGDWGAKLAETPALADVAPWRLAVVLAVGPTDATVGFQPEKFASGEVSDQRERGTVLFSDMKGWARWAPTSERRGRPVKGTQDVLSVGDVIYVEPSTKAGIFVLRQPPEVQGGAVVMDPHTGRVLALVGGFSYFESEFNRATQARRQPGSSFKPFIYASALDNGYTPSSVVVDEPIEIPQGPGMDVWRPENYSQEFYGPSTLRTGIVKSRNLMTVRLAMDMGMPVISEYSKRFGIYDNLPPYIAASLGSNETTVLRMTSAYSMLANGGKQIRPTLIDRIQDRKGASVYRHDDRQCEACNAEGWSGQDEPKIVDKRDQILDPMTAYQMVSMLEGVVTSGTGTTIKAVGKPLAGKTGTTNDAKDVWFVGFSPDLAVGVFMGYDQPKSLGDSATAGKYAAPIFRDMMKMALKDKPATPFRVPPGIKLIRISASNGLRAGGGEGAGVILEAFKPGTAPPDNYSIIGYSGAGGGLAVTPEAERAAGAGTGGLY